MSPTLTLSTRIYSGILSLYPSELRRDFGAEMARVFAEDLEDSYRNRGFAGIARVWWRSIKEVWRIALPEQAWKREIAVPFIVFVLNELYLDAVLLVARGENHEFAGLVSAGHVIGTIAGSMLFSLVPALTVFVALRVGNGSVPDPLVLGRK